MDTIKLINFVENSFISELIHNNKVTDISFNGVNVFYVDNDYGRLKSDIKVNETEIRDFLRQIANICEKQFSFQSPFLDVSFGKYRLNAVHHSIGRNKDVGCVTFSLRIASEKYLDLCKENFLPLEIKNLFECILLHKQSIVIAGLTGSGKTELQKYLISLMNDNERVIIIDNVLELSHINEDRLDISSWQADEQNISSSIRELVRNALRNNPDWLIVAEARGEEMLEVLNSSMTGHSIITTLHSSSLDTIISRIISMVMMNDKKLEKSNIEKDIYENIHYFVYCKKVDVGKNKIKRFIDKIAYVNSLGEATLIYERNNQNYLFYSLPEEAINLLENDKTIPKIFKSEATNAK